MTSTGAVVLTVISDAVLAASTDRVIAAIGARQTRIPMPTRRNWLAATAIVLDETAARRCVQAGLPRRDEVALVGEGAPSADIWALAVDVGARYLCELPAQEAELVRYLAGAAESGSAAGGRGPVIAVTSGGGGGGASVFAAALGGCAESPLLVDLDPCGGGIDLVLGGESAPGLRWPELQVQCGRLSWTALREALPRHRGISMLSGTRTFHQVDAGAVGAVLEAARRGGATVVCDMPRQLTPAADRALQFADLVVVVTSCDVRGIASTSATLGAIRRLNPAVGLVVRGPSPGGLLAAEVAEAVGAPLLAAMRPEPLLTQRLDKGGLRLGRRSPLAQAASAVLGVVQHSVGRAA